MLNTTSAHAVRQAYLADADLLGHKPPARDQQVATAPVHPYAFFRAPLTVDAKPFTFPSARALAKHIGRVRAGRTIQLSPQVHRQFALARPMHGVGVWRMEDGQQVELLGWAFLGAGEHPTTRLQAALLDVDPPSPADYADAAYERAA